MEMRKAYATALAEAMSRNDKIVCLDADLAKACGTSSIYSLFPDRCIDLGVCEANMISIAVGLSYYGYIPVCHSFAPFSTRRVYDQIAVGVSYGRANVKIVGADPGICATLNGGTHMTFEDVAIMRTMPDMLVYEPTDSVQLQKALPALLAHEGACYVRMVRKEDIVLFGDDYKFDLMKADVLREGSDITIVTSGVFALDCLKVADILKIKGLNADVICAHTIKPLDVQTIVDSAKKTGRVLVVENSNSIGGLYGAVCESLSRLCPTLCDSVSSGDLIGEVGKLAELKSHYKMTVDDIVGKAVALSKR